MVNFQLKNWAQIFFFENDNSLPLCYIGNETLGLLRTESFNQWSLIPLFIYLFSITINRKIMLRFTVKIWIYPAQPECFFISTTTRLGHCSDTSSEKNELSADFLQILRPQSVTGLLQVIHTIIFWAQQTERKTNLLVSWINSCLSCSISSLFISSSWIPALVWNGGASVLVMAGLQHCLCFKFLCWT